MRKYSTSIIILLCLSLSLNIWAQRDKYIYNPDKKVETAANKRVLPPTVMKEIYRIDFLLPLSIKDLPDKPIALSKIPNSSRVGVYFYEGILMAIDSIEKASNSYFDIFIHDVSNVEDLNALMNTKTLDSTDLIIGAVTSTEIKTLADFAADKQINFMSILSPATANVVNNPYFIIIQPTLEAHLDRIFKFSEQKIGAFPTVVVYNDDVGDYEVFSYYKRNIRRLTREVKLSNGVLDTKDLIKELKPNNKNIIYATILSQVAANNFLEKLKDIPKEYELEVIGLPSWKGIKNMNNDSMPAHINIYITTPFSYDSDEVKMNKFQSDYKRFNRGIPSEFAYRGYETTIWASDLLTNYGTIFNKNMYKQKAYFCDYNVISRNDDKGNLLFMENNALKVYKYNKGENELVKD